MKKTTVSIGMPVYNGEPFIREALDSLLSQSFTDYEFIISDNASTDGTEAICREYAAKDARIRYVRQMENLGATANFNVVLDEAIGEFFMWAAADDKRSENFIEENLIFLSNNHEFVASTSPVRFEDSDFNELSMGDFSLDQTNRIVRICKFFTKWHANGRFYSLIRRESLIDYPFRNEDYLGADWAWVVHLASKGKLKRIQTGWVCLGTTGVSRKTNIFKKYNRGISTFIVPFGKLLKNTLTITNGIPLYLFISLIIRWVILNIRACTLNIKWFLAGKRV